jgi:hypothetical protein
LEHHDPDRRDHRVGGRYVQHAIDRRGPGDRPGYRRPGEIRRLGRWPFRRPRFTDAGQFTGVARPVGVLAGVIAASRKLPFIAAGHAAAVAAGSAFGVP